MKPEILSNEEIQKLHAYWRAANYLSVGQIYLLENPLLQEPLKIQHVKPRLLGHWGTTPGLNFIYVYIAATGLHELEKLADRLRSTGRTLLLCGARSQPEQFLRQSPFLRYLGEQNMLPHVEAALSRAREVYEGRAGAPPVSKVIYQT